jgi:dihydroxyacid dehydratase/phosphogluconate dehydratase
MSGTAYGTVVLHVSPESAIGGNLGLVQNGDMIELDVPNKKIHLEVSDEELANTKKEMEERRICLRQRLREFVCETRVTGRQRCGF